MKKVVLGIDIGGTNTAFGFIDEDGYCYGKGHIATQAFPDLNDYIEELYNKVEEVKVNIIEKFEILGIGVGAPNANYYSGNIENAVNISWEGVIPLAKLLTKRFSIPVRITNDANAAAIGEKVFGAAKSLSDFIVITIGTGLGSGIVVNGKLVYGHDGFAGEIGHIIVEREGRECGCGRKGCLETYVSASGVRRTVCELIANSSQDSEFRAIPFSDFSTIQIAKAAEKGDEIAKEAYLFTAKILGEALANVVAVISPATIFLFGGLAKSGDLLFEPVRKSFEKSLLPIYRNKIKILPSGLKENAAVLGAAALIWGEI